MFATIKKPTLAKLYLIPLITNITQSMSGSIGVLYALDLGADVLLVNLITTIQGAMTIFLEVPFGILSDRIGRKRMLVYPRVLTFLGTTVRAFATEPNHLLLAAFVGGFAGGGFFPVLLSMIGDIAEPEEEREAISILFLFSSLGMLLGPLLCSLLLMQPQVTLRNIYQIHLVSSMGTELFVITQVRETKPQTPKDDKMEYRAYFADLIGQRNFRGLLIMTFLYNLFFSIMGTYIPIYARENLSLSDAEVASFSTYRNLGNILVRFSITTFLTKAPIKVFLLSALVLGGITGLAVPFVNDYLSVSLILFLSGVSFGAKMILGHTLVAGCCTSRNRGIANGVYAIAQSAGNITKVLTSPLFEAQGIASVFILGGFTALVATIPPLLHKTHPEQSH